MDFQFRHRTMSIGILSETINVNIHIAMTSPSDVLIKCKKPLENDRKTHEITTNSAGISSNFSLVARPESSPLVA